MATSQEKAVELKNQGNKAFADRNWPKAIDLYSKAIELNDKDHTYFSNRAQVGAQTIANTPRVSPTLLA